MYRIKNTANDRTKHFLHRTATKFEVEPSLGGRRIFLNSHCDVSDEHYERVKPTVDEWVKKGMVSVFLISDDGTGGPKINTEGLELGGPTIEEWKAAGYPADNYPPKGYAEVFSPGLVALRRAQEEAVAEQAKVAAEIIKEALELPSVTEQILPATPVQEPEPPVVEVSTPVVIPQPAPVPAPVFAPSPPTIQASNKQDPNKNRKLR